MIGKILEVADKNTLVIVVSDHGAVAGGPHVPLNDILAERGLLAYGEDGEGEQRTIDWSRTKAVAQRSMHVYVNLKGREPHGLVEPEQYDHIVREVIDALVEYVEPTTGRHPFSLVLAKSDARMIGLYGDRVGDVIYAVYPEFGGQHGQQLPTAEYGIGSLRGLLIMAGPELPETKGDVRGGGSVDPRLQQIAACTHTDEQNGRAPVERSRMGTVPRTARAIRARACPL